MSRLLYTQVPEPGPPCADPGVEDTPAEMGQCDGAENVPSRSSGSRPGLERPSNSGPPGWESPGAECGARTSRAGQGRAGGAPAAGARRRSLPRSRRGSLCKSGRTCPGRGLRSSGPPLHFLLLPAPLSPLAQPRAAASATAAVTLAAHPHPSCKPSRAEPSPAESTPERLRAWPRPKRVGPTESPPLAGR